LWALDNKATVNDIIANWTDDDKPGYTTVLKMLQIMEEKRIVGHRRKGRAYTYIAKVSKDDSLKHNLSKVISDFFGGNRILLANSLIEEESFSKEELDGIKKMIARKEKVIRNG
jgi:predicted transcriptional regulator